MKRVVMLTGASADFVASIIALIIWQSIRERAIEMASRGFIIGSAPQSTKQTGDEDTEMKRFNLPLSDHLYTEFFRCFPDRGARTTLLRTTVHRLVQRAKLKNGQVYKEDALSIAEDLEWERED